MIDHFTTASSFLLGGGFVTLVALIGKLLDYWRDRSKDGTTDKNTRIQEYRDDIATLKREIEEKDAELEKERVLGEAWRDKYYQEVLKNK